jgi:hypothetical protein
MRIGKFANLVRNKTTGQFSLNLKKKQLERMGLTPTDLLNVKLPDKQLIVPKKRKIINHQLKKWETFR